MEQLNHAWYAQVERGLYDGDVWQRRLDKRRARYAKRNATPKYAAKKAAYEERKANALAANQE